MSICQVKNFFDAVRKYKTKDAVVTPKKLATTWLSAIIT